jgi:hypothetical protein
MLTICKIDEKIKPRKAFADLLVYSCVKVPNTKVTAEANNFAVTFSKTYWI